MLQGCEKEIPYYQEDMYNMALTEDPDAKPVLGDLAETTLNLCEKLKYGDGCMKVVRAEVLKFQIIFVEFNSFDAARKEAKRIDQWYVRNWVIDDVTGEPPLERFVQKVYQAKRPTKAE